jgi:glycerol kinase
VTPPPDSPTVVAIDAGTTGVRALAVDAQARVTDVAYRELTQHFPRPGWVEHDPDEIWTAVRDTLAELATRLAETKPSTAVAAIGITNQRETLVAFDRSTGRPLHRAIVWQDRRTAQLCAELSRAGHLPLVRARTGLVLDPYFSATKAVWLLRHGDLALAPDDPNLSFCTVDTWVLWNLTGGAAYATDPSNASRTLLLNTETLAWDPELCDLFGVPLRTLPEVRPSAGRLGTASLADLDPPAAAGVLDGVPVSAVLGDQQAALFGQACVDPGMVKVTYGTGSFVLANAGPQRPPAPEGLVVSCAWDLGAHADPVRGRVAYALEGSTFVSGAAIQWLRDGLGIINAASDVGPLASSVPDSGGVTFVPALTGLGSPWWDPDARGIITGLTRGAGRAQLARACVEAMAFQVRDMTDAMSAAMSAPSETTASAQPLSALRADGGAAAMDLLLELQAEHSRVPVARPRSLESTALGAATMAGLAEGVWSSLDELAALWEAETVFEPQLPAELADATYAVWRRSVEKAKGWAVSDQVDTKEK